MKKINWTLLRQKRNKAYEKIFDAPSLFISGLLIMPALLFCPVPVYRVFQFAGFWFLCWLSGKKNNPVFTILIIFSIIAFNLIIPYGKILYSAGIFKITSGALMTGIQRAATLEGLIMLSRFTVRSDLKLPGRGGELISLSYRYFALIGGHKPPIKSKSLIADIDQMLIELSEIDLSDAGNPGYSESSRTRLAGYSILAAIVFLAWLPWFFI